MHDQTVIKFSNRKNILSIIMGLVFVFMGIWMLSMDTQTIENLKRFNNPTLFHGTGFIAIVFFSLVCFWGVKNLFDNSPGLIVSSDGILDNSSAVSAGFIPWEEIVGVGEYEVGKQKFISIQVQDPEKYANNGNYLQRLANNANIEMCGTPVNISSISLKIGHEDLFETINDYYLITRENAS